MVTGPAKRQERNSSQKREANLARESLKEEIENIEEKTSDIIEEVMTVPDQEKDSHTMSRMEEKRPKEIDMMITEEDLKSTKQDKTLEMTETADEKNTVIRMLQVRLLIIMIETLIILMTSSMSQNQVRFFTLRMII